MTVTVPVEFARPPARPARFADVVRAEWRKLTSLRSTWITLAVAVALGVGLGALISHLAANAYGTPSQPASGWNPTNVSLDGLGIAQLAIAVLGALVITSEYGSGMIRTSLIATPRRSRFLAAKACVFAAVALAVGEVIAFAAFFLGQFIIGSSAPHATIGGHQVLRAVVGSGLYLAAIGLLACLIGALLRNTAAAISAMVALLFVLPAIATALPASWANAVSKWWPTEAGSRVTTVGRAAHTLAAWPGFGVLIAFTAIVAIAAVAMIERRDA